MTYSDFHTPGAPFATLGPGPYWQPQPPRGTSDLLEFARETLNPGLAAVPAWAARMGVRGKPVEWEGFYKTARWRRLRKFQLVQHPLCKFCLERGIVTAANVVDHVEPYRGDWTKFVTGKLQSLCEPCHRSGKRQIELRGYRRDIGLDGLPIDPNHPFNRAG